VGRARTNALSMPFDQSDQVAPRQPKTNEEALQPPFGQIQIQFDQSIHRAPPAEDCLEGRRVCCAPLMLQLSPHFELNCLGWRRQTDRRGTEGIRMFWKRTRRIDALNVRCRDYLEKGPPLHMTNYVPGSVTEMIIAHGVQGKHLDAELSDAAEIILLEAEDL